mgnify:FL=1
MKALVKFTHLDLEVDSESVDNKLKAMAALVAGVLCVMLLSPQCFDFPCHFTPAPFICSLHAVP